MNRTELAAAIKRASHLTGTFRLRSGAIDRGMLNLSGSGANELCIGHFVARVEQALAG